MGYSSLLGALMPFPQLTRRNDDDMYDRLSHRWTAGTLILFAILVTTKTYVRDSPISCWVPKEFTGSWERYTNSYCWVKNTYYLPWHERIPTDIRERQRNPIIYYQWIPLILFVQAIMFYMPICIWRSFSGKTGMDINDIIHSAEKCAYIEDDDTRDAVLRYVTRRIHRSLAISKKVSKGKRCCNEGGCCRCNCKYCLAKYCRGLWGRNLGHYMVTLYVITKIIFLINAVGQLFLLNWFLGQDFSMYGIYVIREILAKNDWIESPRFPRVTLCDFQIRRLGNLHRYTVQCVLPINYLNEKIYFYLWFWLLLIALLTFIGLLTWILRFSISREKYKYVINFLVASKFFQADLKSDQTLVKKFVDEYLRADGIFVMRLVDINTNKMTMQTVLCNLWEHYIELPSIKKVIRDEVLDIIQPV